MTFRSFPFASTNTSFAGIAGTGLTNAGTNLNPIINFDITSLASTVPLTTDELCYNDSGTPSRATISAVPLSIFNDDLSYSPPINTLSVTTPVTGDWIAFDDAGTPSKALISSIPLSIFSDDLSYSVPINTLSVTVPVTGDWIAFDDAGTPSKALISSIPLSIFSDDLSYSSPINSLGVSTMVTGDWIAFDNAGTPNKALISAIPLSIFNNDSNWNNYTHPTTDGNVHLPSGGSAGQHLVYASAGTASWTSTIDATALNGVADTGYAKLGTVSDNEDNYVRFAYTGASTTPTLSVNNPSTGPIARFYKGSSISSTDSGTNKIEFTQDADIQADGSLTAQHSSDERIKSDIRPIEEALVKVNMLRTVDYEKEGLDVRETGLIAQDVENVLDEMVKENGKGIKTIKTGGHELIALAMAAIKELSAEVEELKARL